MPDQDEQPKIPAIAAVKAPEPPPGPQLDFDEALDAEDIEYVTVNTPEWKGGSVVLGSIDSGKSLDFLDLHRNITTRKDSLFRLVCMCMVNRNKERIPEEQLDSAVDRLKKRNPKVVNRLVDAAMDLNGISVKKKDDAKNDLSGAPNAGSPTDSPKSVAA